MRASGGIYTLRRIRGNEVNKKKRKRRNRWTNPIIRCDNETTSRTTSPRTSCPSDPSLSWMEFCNRPLQGATVDFSRFTHFRHGGSRFPNLLMSIFTCPSLIVLHRARANLKMRDGTFLRVTCGLTSCTVI